MAPSLGITLFVCLLFYAVGYLIFYCFADNILQANPQNDTMPTYLGRYYQSKALKYVSLFFLLIYYASLFSLELIIGVTVLAPFLGAQVLGFAALYCLFIIIYALMGGYRAIIATDTWQLRFIVLSLCCLLFLGIFQAWKTPSFDITLAFRSVIHSWQSAWAFIIGIMALNLTAQLIEPGAWQRLCSTQDVAAAKRGLRQSVVYFVGLWTFLILFACIYSYLAVEQGFNAEQETLMTFIVHAMGSSGMLLSGVLCLFILGLFSAMISTADSALVVLGQAFSIDVMKIDRDRHHPQRVLRKSRIAIVMIALPSFGVFFSISPVKTGCRRNCLLPSLACNKHCSLRYFLACLIAPHTHMAKK